MRVCTTTAGGKFLVDRCRLIVSHLGVDYYLTAAGNIVGEQPDGTFTEISRAVAEANIMLMPYDIAKELFPANPVFVETI